MSIESVCINDKGKENIDTEYEPNSDEDSDSDEE